MVVARAVVRDLHDGGDAAKYFSRLTLVFGIAPIAAPSLGSVVLQFGSWRWIFAVLAVVGLLIAAAVARWLPETLPAEHRHTGGLADTGRAVRVLATDRIYVGYALTQGLVLASLFAYISASPFVFQEVFGLPVGVFSLLFGLNAVGLVVAGQVNARLLDRFPPRTLLVVTLAAGVVIGVGVLVGAAAGSLILVAVTLFAFLGSLGMVLPNGTALALDRHPRHAGTAAALMGALQSVCAALAAPLVGLGGTGSAVPMAVVLLAASLLSLATTLVLTGGRQAPA